MLVWISDEDINFLSAEHNISVPVEMEMSLHDGTRGQLVESTKYDPQQSDVGLSSAGLRFIEFGTGFHEVIGYKLLEVSPTPANINKPGNTVADFLSERKEEDSSPNNLEISESMFLSALKARYNLEGIHFYNSRSRNSKFSRAKNIPDSDIIFVFSGTPGIRANTPQYFENENNPGRAFAAYIPLEDISDYNITRLGSMPAAWDKDNIWYIPFTSLDDCCFIASLILDNLGRELPVEIDNNTVEQFQSVTEGKLYHGDLVLKNNMRLDLHKRYHNALVKRPLIEQEILAAQSGIQYIENSFCLSPACHEMILSESKFSFSGTNINFHVSNTIIFVFTLTNTGWEVSIISEEANKHFLGGRFFNPDIENSMIQYFKDGDYQNLVDLSSNIIEK